MSTTELRELDLWIGERIMKFNTAVDLALFRPTTDPAAAMEVLEKCAKETVVTIEYGASVKNKFQWMVASLNAGREDYCKSAETLPLAIAMFAKGIF